MKKTISKCLVIIMITLLLIPETVQAATVKISKTKATLEVDATLQLKITGSDSTIKWTSSKKSIATVSKKGLVTAVKAGTAKITASIDSKSYSCEVYVVNSKSSSIAVGETVEFTSGEYIVGEDIPTGTYTLDIIDGYGAIKSYITETEYDKNGYNYKSIWLSASDKHEKTYKNFKLTKGNYVIISDGMIVDFTRKK